MSQPLRNAVQLAERKALLARDHSFDLRIERAESAEQRRDRRREIRQNRLSAFILADHEAAARRCQLLQIFVEFPVEIVRHSPSFALSGTPPYEALSHQGEVIASRQ